MKLIISTAILFYLFTNVLPQKTFENGQEQSLLLRRFVKDKINLESSELNFDVTHYYEKFHGNFAIRICSEEQFANLYSPNFGRIGKLLNYFKISTKVPLERIVFLRSVDCYNKSSKVSPIEVWWIKNTDFPPYAEKFKTCQVNLRVLEAEIKKDSYYQHSLLTLREMVNSIDDQTQIIGYVKGYYSNKTNNTLLRRIKKAKQLLANEIKKGIVKVETIKYKSSFSKTGDLFPIISVVKIFSECQ